MFSLGQVSEYIITAPSAGLYVLGPLDLPFVRSGTSFAAPMVTAAAALLKAYRPNASAAKIFDALRHGARKESLRGDDKLGPTFGNGVLDIAKSLSLIDRHMSDPD
jgi:subtilisin family serine protease